MNFVRSLQKGLSSFWQPLKPYDPDTVVIPEMDQLLTRLENRLDKRCLKRKADTEIDKVERRKRYETGARCGDVPSAPQWEEDAGFGVIKGAGCGGLSPETEGNWREGKREEKEMNGGNAGEVLGGELRQGWVMAWGEVLDVLLRGIMVGMVVCC